MAEKQRQDASVLGGGWLLGGRGCSLFGGARPRGLREQAVPFGVPVRGVPCRRAPNRALCAAARRCQFPNRPHDSMPTAPRPQTHPLHRPAQASRPPPPASTPSAPTACLRTPARPRRSWPCGGSGSRRCGSGRRQRRRRGARPAPSPSSSPAPAAPRSARGPVLEAAGLDTDQAKIKAHVTRAAKDRTIQYNAAVAAHQQPAPEFLPRVGPKHEFSETELTCLFNYAAALE
jgi:hypothetical protein